MSDPRQAEPGHLTRAHVYKHAGEAASSKIRRVAKVLFWSAAIVVLLGILPVVAGGSLDPIPSAIATGLAILFLVAGICCWVAGGD